jgi:hypothetical protein
MNQVLNLSGQESGYEMRRMQIDILLADPFVPLKRHQVPNHFTNVGRGKLVWVDVNTKWVLYYDTSQLCEDDFALIPHVKEFYAYFKAIEFYPEYEEYLRTAFLDNFDDINQKIRFIMIMLDDFRSTKDVTISGANKVDAKQRIIEEFEAQIGEYYGVNERTDEKAIISSVRDALAKTGEAPKFQAAE